MDSAIAIRLYLDLTHKEPPPDAPPPFPVCETNPLANCSDVFSRRFPILLDTTCDTSGIPGTGNEDLNWGVCALD